MIRFDPLADAPLPDAARAAVVAFGNFDGVHRGHRRLLAAGRELAGRLGTRLVAATFDPHPAALLRPGSLGPPLTPPARKAALLRAAGAAEVVALKTTPELLALDPAEFFRRTVQGAFAAAGVVEGENFRFGRGRAGDGTLLESLCGAAGLGLRLTALADWHDAPCSSSVARTALEQGDLATYRAVTGRPHLVRGVVGPGAGRGRTIGVPTANLAEPDAALPADGVYAIAATTNDGRHLSGACNVGPNPTFGEHARKVEAHLFDFAGDLYGQPLELAFLARLRGTQTFAGIAALQAQLARDFEAARAAAAAVPPPAEELLATVEEWVRLEAAPALAPLRAAFLHARRLGPQEIRLAWRLEDALPPAAGHELLFGLEERLLGAFPEFRHALSETA